MSDSVITVSGLQETQRTLYAYSQQMGDRVVRMALRQGANYVLKSIREGVPVRTGLLKRRGFRVANSRIHNGKRQSEMIGLYIGLRKGKGDPFYGRFQNDGWVPRGFKSNGMWSFHEGALRGGKWSRTIQRDADMANGKRRVPGKGFVQRAFAERKEAAVELIVRAAEAGAESVKRRLGMK